MLHIKSKDTSIEVKLRKALWCRDIDIRRIIMSFRANQILQLPSILNNIINKHFVTIQPYGFIVTNQCFQHWLCTHFAQKMCKMALQNSYF